MVSLLEIVVFSLSKKVFSTHTIMLDDAKNDSVSPPICGMAMIADHKN